jgi:hypothetical protein
MRKATVEPTGHREERKRRGDLVARAIRTLRDCFAAVSLAMMVGENNMNEES